MLTPYDEFPVHQTSRPFSEIPSTDHSWDDGYFFGVYSAKERVFLFTGMRINANADVVGGYAGINHNGVQHTVRLSRTWRPDFDTSIGPLSFRFVEPMRKIRLTLGENDSDLQFDLTWDALAPPYEEAHHLAINRSRPVTDQTRYTQGGTAAGQIRYRDRTFEVAPLQWFGSRDHSWGLYASREPLRPDPRWLPPPEVPAVRRALRFWLPFQTREYSGFYHFHEDSAGRQLKMNDTFGTPFEGVIHYGFDGPVLRMASARHKLEFMPGTRAISRGVVDLVDEHGGAWQHVIEVASPPWSPATIGYNVDGGSWRDGGSIATYHGPGVYIEHDEFDFSNPPYRILNHQGKPMRPHGREHIAVVHSTDPAGRTAVGLGQLEFVCEGRYEPYGFDE
jgi:hypothetical protein